jgi:hypothetical protein
MDNFALLTIVNLDIQAPIHTRNLKHVQRRQCGDKFKTAESVSEELTRLV